MEYGTVLARQAARAGDSIAGGCLVEYKKNPVPERLRNGTKSVEAEPGLARLPFTSGAAPAQREDKRPEERKQAGRRLGNGRVIHRVEEHLGARLREIIEPRGL